MDGWMDGLNHYPACSSFRRSMSQAFQALKSIAIDSQAQTGGIKRSTEAAVSANMTFSRLLSRAVLINRAGSRSAFTNSKTDTSNPNWLQVGLAFGTSAFIWGLLFKQHSTDVHEYEVKKGLQ